MPLANTIVDLIQRIDRPAQAAAGPRAPVTVHLGGGRVCQLDPSDPRSPAWEFILGRLHQQGRPAFLEIDPQRNAVRQLLAPKAVRVTSVAPQPAGGMVEVELYPSQARHFVRTTNPDAQQLLNELRAAERQHTLVLVTEASQGPEIIDVRAAPALRPLPVTRLGVLPCP